MDLDQFIVAVFCHVDDAMNHCFAGTRIRERGPAPTLCDSEVLTMELVGSFLGIAQDKALHEFFGRHYSHFFPAVVHLHRTSFTRQAAGLWKVKERLWQHLIPQIPHDPAFSLIDSFPLPVCRFARAKRCRRFRAEVAFGKDTVARQTFYGFRIHVRLAWPGVIAGFCVAAGNVQEVRVAPDLVQGWEGTLLGDRNYWSPDLREELALQEVDLVAPYRSKQKDPHPQMSRHLSPLRYRIDTVFGQLCDRFAVKQVWARDAWHLYNRLLRVVLSHTLATLINHRQGNQMLRLEQLVTA